MEQEIQVEKISKVAVQRRYNGAMHHSNVVIAKQTVTAYKDAKAEKAHKKAEKRAQKLAKKHHSA